MTLFDGAIYGATTFAWQISGRFTQNRLSPKSLFLSMILPAPIALAAISSKPWSLPSALLPSPFNSAIKNNFGGRVPPPGRHISL